MSMQCSICLDLFKGAKQEDIISTTCGHVFHQTCILPWIEKSKNCPDCRKVLNNTDVIKLYLIFEETSTNDSTGSVATCRKVALRSRASICKKDYAKENASLAAQLADIKFERKDLILKNKKLEKTLENLKMRCDAKNEKSLQKIRDLRNEKKTFQLKIKKLEKELGKSTAKETTLKEQIENQRSTHNAIVDILENNIRRLEEQLRNSKDGKHLDIVQVARAEMAKSRRRSMVNPRLLKFDSPSVNTRSKV